MAQPPPPPIPGPAVRLHQAPAPLAGVVALNLPAGAQQQVQQQYNNHLDNLRRQAGPQLIATLPPWFRPGPVHGQQHLPPWPSRSPTYMIPMALHPDWIPDINTYQDGVNHFLRLLDSCFGGSVGALAQATRALGNLDRCRFGPRIYTRQVSSRSRLDRQAVFPYYATGTLGTFMFGVLPNPVPRMRLSEYSATCHELRRDLILAPGMLFTIASPEPSAHATGQSTMLQNFMSSLPAHLQGFIPGPAANVNVWHAAGLFIQSHTHYPVRQPGLAPDLPLHLGWTFTSRFRAVYVYDSSFPNESADTRPVTHSMQTGTHSRIGDHQMLSMVQRVLYSEDGLSPRTGNRRVGWLRDAGMVRIGGGGNIGGIDECQRMTAIWMMQVAQLSRALSHAIYCFFHHPTPQSYQEFIRAEYEWQQFFSDYIEIRA